MKKIFVILIVCLSIVTTAQTTVDTLPGHKLFRFMGSVPNSSSLGGLTFDLKITNAYDTAFATLSGTLRQCGDTTSTDYAQYYQTFFVAPFPLLRVMIDSTRVRFLRSLSNSKLILGINGQ